MADATDIARLRELCKQLVRRAEDHPTSAGAFADGVAALLAIHVNASHGDAKPPRRTGRRDAPLLDPFEIYREDPGKLADRLSALGLEQLRDIVAFYGMDPRRLVMKWKTADRVIAHIAETVETRSRKGDAFRAPNPAS